MTSIAPAAVGGNGITFGDVASGVGGAAITATTAGLVGVGAGAALGSAYGGIGTVIGGMAGGVAGIAVGAGAGIATGGTILALRGNGRDLTKPGAISGAVGGALGGAALTLGAGDAKAKAAFIVGGAITGGLIGAGVGSIFD